MNKLQRYLLFRKIYKYIKKFDTIVIGGENGL